MFLTASPNNIAFSSVVSFVGGYGIASMRSIGLVFMLTVLGPLAAAAYFFNQWIIDFGGHLVYTYSTGGLTMLGALLLQVLGHKRNEVIEAADPRHGLLAAPVLEFTR